MSAPPRDPSDPQEWLRRARSNLARAAAGRPTSEVLLEDLAFDAQQAAEKAIKAVLVGRRIAPPRTHSFGPLIALVEDAGIEVPGGLQEVTSLTKYSVRFRYPTMESVTEEQYRDALAVARAVVGWAERAIEDALTEERDDSPEAPQGGPDGS